MEISKFLKMSFMIDGLIALVYGLVLLLIPDIHNSFFGYTHEEFSYRFIGALFIGYAIGNLLAYRASSWENVEFVVWMNIVFLGIGLIVILYSIAVAVLPVMAFTQVGISSFLLILFVYGYYEAKMK